MKTALYVVQHARLLGYVRHAERQALAGGGVDDGAMVHCGKLPEMVENFLFRVPRYGTGYRYLCGRILFILLRKESMNVETEKKLLLCQRMIMKI